jgi:hypothetical protein
MMTSEKAMELAVKYEELGNERMMNFYFNMALRREDFESVRNSMSELKAAYAAMKSATRSVTGSIHR